MEKTTRAVCVLIADPGWDGSATDPAASVERSLDAVAIPNPLATRGDFSIADAILDDIRALPAWLDANP